jgi:hypothetical protein
MISDEAPWNFAILFFARMTRIHREGSRSVALNLTEIVADILLQAFLSVSLDFAMSVELRSASK